MSDDPQEIQEWLRRLTWSLAAIPSPEREDIVEEARAHLREAIANGASPSAALAGFGDASEYARQFVDDMDVSNALASQRAGTMLSVIGRRIHRSVVAALAGILIVVLALSALVSVIVLIDKIGDPVHVGLWRGAHEFFIGEIDDPSRATDLLGNWLYPLAAAIIFGAWFLGRVVLLVALRSLARNR